MNTSPIGVFDSGIGGLTVTKEIIKLLPNESIIYLGDTARVPYGTRSPEVVTKFALELVNFLLERNVKCLVVACNTISAICLDKIIKVSPVPVVGVIQPAVKKAVKLSKGKIGVIGTPGTIKSRSYQKEIKRLRNKAKVYSLSCPLFVPLAEEGLYRSEAAKLIARGYLGRLAKEGIDTLILGCTHYPILNKVIKEVMGDKVVLVDSAKPTVKELKKILQEEHLLNENTTPSYEFYVTDAPARVYQVAGRFFGEKINGKLKKINLSAV